MPTKKKSRGRLEIAADIFNVFEQKLAKRKEKQLLVPLIAEMEKFEVRAAKRHEKQIERLSKLPQLCSHYEIWHGRGCGKCSACLEDSGERYHPNKPKFLT